jgi:hypothetical protein
VTWHLKNPLKPKSEIKIACIQCGVEFSCIGYAGKGFQRKYCSQSCYQAFHHAQHREKLKTIKTCGRLCSSCGVDLRLIENKELSCWLRACPNRTDEIDDAKLDEYASEVAKLGLDTGTMW